MADVVGWGCAGNCGGDDTVVVMAFVLVMVAVVVMSAVVMITQL